ncbi:hypothetical protein [Alysiella crassa]|uniref:Uncharacterized protein n=1 Tax=Alysiella crassa TaxID=153491 RepID=A0A376BU96_9NEIS|nr:hypothetical protein [Alysiella crassa]UOP06084.1 hypothetical protein LVJ80_09595 [Alysiella crassa]SSY80547.1 Uncharacterised protein [Alysiella crassa]
MINLHDYQQAITEFNEHIAEVQLRYLRKKIAATLHISEPKTPRHLLAAQLHEIEWEKYIQTPLSSPHNHAPPPESRWQLETPYEEVCDFLAWAWQRLNSQQIFYGYQAIEYKIEKVAKFAFQPLVEQIMSVCFIPSIDLPDWQESYQWAMQKGMDKLEWVKPEILMNKIRILMAEQASEFLKMSRVVVGKNGVPSNLAKLKNNLDRLPEKTADLPPESAAPETPVKPEKPSKNNKIKKSKPPKIASQAVQTETQTETKPEPPKPISQLPKMVYDEELALIQAAWLPTKPKKIDNYQILGDSVLPAAPYRHHGLFACLAEIDWARYAVFRQPENECVAEISSENQEDNKNPESLMDTGETDSALAQELQKIKQENKELLDLLHLHDEEMKVKDDEISQLKQKIMNLQAASKKNTPTEIEGKPLLQYGQEADLYDDEILSFVRQTLEYSVKNQSHNNSRHQHILLDLLKANPLPQDIRAEKNEALRNAMRTYTRMDNPTRQALINIGFTITEDGAHYKLVFMDDGRYTCTTSKTSSDNRAGKNFARDVGNLLF